MARGSAGLTPRPQEFLFVCKAILQDFDVCVVPGQQYKAVNGPVIFWEKGVKATIKRRVGRGA